MFTPGQVSDMLEVPPSTLRRYVKQFVKHLSESATKKRGRRFTEQDIATLARARELLTQGRKPKETDELLAVVGDDDPEAQPDAALALVPSISEALAGALDVARGLRAEVDDLSEKQGDTAARVRGLEAWLREPWYRRIFGSPTQK